MKNNQMKMKKIWITLAFLVLISAIKVNAQIKAPIKKILPMLIVEGYRGNILIEGYEGDSILIKNPSKEIPYQLEKQNENKVFFRTNSVQMLDYELKVPKDMYIKITWKDSGTIHIDNMQSGIEIEAKNSNITLNKIKANIFIQNEDGNIIANFVDIQAKDVVSINSITGNILVNLPLYDDTEFRITSSTEATVPNEFIQKQALKNLSSQLESKHTSNDYSSEKPYLNANKNDFNIKKEKSSKENISLRNNRQEKKDSKLKYITPLHTKYKIGKPSKIIKLSTRTGKVEIKKSKEN
jgi:hypothetical protein